MLSSHSLQKGSQLQGGQFCIFQVHWIQPLQLQGGTGLSGPSGFMRQELLQTWKSPVILLTPFES
ncbi:hypothetical protein II582_04775 [bacterium]|nr:hypothetical protein [bacterium]